MKQETDPTLRRLSRNDIVNQMSTALAAIDEKDIKDVSLRIKFKSGEEVGVFRVSNDEDEKTTEITPILGKFAALLEAMCGIGVIDAKKVFMSPEQFVKELSEAKYDDVTIDGRHAVGRVLAFILGGKAVITLFPVPKNIDEIREWIDEKMRNACQIFRSGKRCWSCPRHEEDGFDWTACEIAIEVEKLAMEHFDGEESGEEDENAQP